uniref:Rho-GAP domain-containing protein n=1 Tax=Syphacia muris TaxID=451379 RepID=A0A0N5AJ45_9BILA
MTDSGKENFFLPPENSGSSDVAYSAENNVGEADTGPEDDASQEYDNLNEYDDERVYANMEQLQKESISCGIPPSPDVNENPVRILGNGWFEYTTESGRPYFFNSERGESSWKPPRFQISKLSEDEETTEVPLNEVKIYSESAINDDFTSSDAELHIHPSSTEDEHIYTDPNSSLSNDYGFVRHFSTTASKPTVTFNRVKASRNSASVLTTATSSLEYNASSNESNVSQKSVKSGNLDKVSGILRSGTLNLCKLAEAGVNVKKKEWTSCYVFLSSAHLIFYKDAKSAEKLGKHYEAPLGMCELRGAKLQWYEDKRRKHVIELRLADGTIYLFNTLNCQDINSWFHAMKRVIRRQPLPDSPSTPVLERGSSVGISRIGSLSQSTSSTYPNSSQSKKLKSNKEGADDDLFASKARVISILKRFFRSRPTIETLKEKGIYRTEPVFGNALLSICQQENSLVPRFLKFVTEVIELKGIEADGIYRVSGNLSSIQRIRCAVDQDRYEEVFNEEDVHVLTGALKLFFRELSEPIFPAAISDALIAANKLPKGSEKLHIFNEILKELPLVHKESLKVLLSHLIRVSQHSSQNRMEVHNLAIVFGPSLFGTGINAQSELLNKPASKDKLAPHPAQNNSNFVFSMIMQGQIIEYLLNEFYKFSAFHDNLIEETSV